MRDPHPLLVVASAALAGALLTLGVGLLALGPEDASHLIVPLAVAVALTVGATALGVRVLSGASLRVRFVSIAAFATVVGLANLVVLAEFMIVNPSDALMLATLLVYSTAAALGAAFAASRTSSLAMERLSETARRMAEGDLDARAAHVGGGAELEELAAALDEMAERLSVSLGRERAIEAQRRDLVVAVSHDLRTPLADLKAMTEAIHDRVVEDPGTIRVYAEKISGSVEALAALVDDLFEFVQLDAGAIEAESRKARLDEVVRAAMEGCDAQASEKGLVVSASLGDAESAACSPRLARVIHNLLQNAIRHTPTDGTVVIEASQAGSGIELAVEDSGEGLDPAAREQVFEPFWRGDAARGSDGSGLGLALSKRIVEGLGGSIEVESAPARGARFAILLPTTPVTPSAGS